MPLPVLLQALQHASPVLRAAALPGLAALSAEAHAALSLPRQTELWVAVSQAMVTGQPATVKAVATATIGHLATLPSFVAGQTGATSFATI